MPSNTVQISVQGESSTDTQVDESFNDAVNHLNNVGSGNKSAFKRPPPPDTPPPPVPNSASVSSNELNSESDTTTSNTETVTNNNTTLNNDPEANNEPGANNDLESNNDGDNPGQDTNRRSPSYHSSVLQSSEFTVDDPNINVSAENVQYIEKLYQQLKNMNRGLKVNKNNINMVIVRGVEIVNTWKQIDLAERDDVVIQALLTLVRNFELPDAELEYLEVTIRTTINMIFKSLSGEVVKKKTRSDRKKQKQTVKKLRQDNDDRVSTGQILENIIDKLDSIIRKEKYQPMDLVTNLAVIVGMVINFVEKYNYLSGMEKKEIVVQSIQVVVTEKLPELVHIDVKTQKIINVAMDGLPQTVDLLVAVSNGKFEIKMEDIGRCFTRLLPLIRNLGVCRTVQA